MNKKTIKKIIFGLLATVVALIPLQFAHADVGDLAMNSVISIFTWGAKTILFTIGYVFSWGVYIGGALLNWALDLNAGIVNNPAVNIGWTLSRDIVNMGFVLLIIIIAFSTILRLGDFTLKKALPKLIIAALLINFSILIATVFLDGAGIFTSYFLNSSFDSKNTSGGISQVIGGSLSLGSFLETPQITEDLTTFSASSVKMIANLVFIDIMTAVGAITMITLAMMFLIRYVMIGILLIIMPAAILMWVIGSSQWGKWLDSFFKYTFFGPIAAFFIYIALQSSAAFNSLAKVKFINVEGDINGISGLIGHIGSEIMMVALLLGGLMVADKMSIMGAKMGLAAANGAMKFIGKATRKGAMFPLRATGLTKMGEKFGKTKLGQRFKKGLTTVTEFGGKSSLKSLYGTAVDEIGTKYGMKARKYDEKLAKKEKGDRERAEKRKEQTEKTTAIQEKEAQLANLGKTLAQKEGDLRSATVGFHPPEDTAKTESLKKEIEDTKKQIEIVNKEKTTIKEGLENTKNEGFEKLQKAVEELGEKTKETKKE